MPKGIYKKNQRRYLDTTTEQRSPNHPWLLKYQTMMIKPPSRKGECGEKVKNGK